MNAHLLLGMVVQVLILIPASIGSAFVLEWCGLNKGVSFGLGLVIGNFLAIGYQMYDQRKELAELRKAILAESRDKP